MELMKLLLISRYFVQMIVESFMSKDYRASMIAFESNGLISYQTKTKILM